MVSSARVTVSCILKESMAREHQEYRWLESLCWRRGADDCAGEVAKFGAGGDQGSGRRSMGAVISDIHTLQSFSTITPITSAFAEVLDQVRRVESSSLDLAQTGSPRRFGQVDRIQMPRACEGMVALQSVNAPVVFNDIQQSTAGSRNKKYEDEDSPVQPKECMMKLPGTSNNLRTPISK